ncbi:MAG: SDR family oxidoreductase [Acidobacteriia bacterium]|nr:SDR family oxidoreductase [Terriglobia bacterium]
MITLTGKSAIVTGGTKGIGRAVAEALLRAGAQVAISARHEDEVRKVASELAGANEDRARGFTCDVRQPQSVAHFVAEVVKTFGRLDLLINNAGMGIFERVEKLSVDQWNQVIETNLSGVFYCCHEALPHLKKQGGWIINIASLAGKNAFPTAAAYNASKFGLVGFSEALMQEVRYDNIRVSYIMPGSVNTEFSGEQPDASKAWQLQPEDVAQAVLDLLSHNPRSLPSRVEIRPFQPPKK